MRLTGEDEGPETKRPLRRRKTWWDRQDEPPQAVMDIGATCAAWIRSLFRARGDESARTVALTVVLLACIFLLLVWLLFLSVAPQL